MCLCVRAYRQVLALHEAGTQALLCKWKGEAKNHAFVPPNKLE